MNKSIVIVDTPINCNECKFCIVDYSFWGDICESKCLLTEKNNIVAIGKEKIDNNCPLKSIPRRLSHLGWIALRDEILGEEE